MTGVKTCSFIGRRGIILGLGRQFQQIFLPGKSPGRISPGLLDRVWFLCKEALSNTFSANNTKFGQSNCFTRIQFCCCCCPDFHFLNATLIGISLVFLQKLCLNFFIQRGVSTDY